MHPGHWRKDSIMLYFTTPKPLTAIPCLFLPAGGKKFTMLTVQELYVFNCRDPNPTKIICVLQFSGLGTGQM